MSDQNDISVKFGANTSDFSADLQKILSALQETMGSMNGALKELTGGLTEISSAMKQVSSDVANMSGFKQVAADMGAFSQGAQEAAGASQGAGAAMGAAEEAANSMGVATRDATGALLSKEQILRNALDSLNSYKEGTEREEAALKLFGRSLAEVNELIKQNGIETEAATKKASGLEQLFGGIASNLKAALGGLAVGALFKMAVAETVQFAYSSEQLARRLGSTATEVGTLQMALNNLYIDTNTYVGAQENLTRQLRNNEENLKAMGVVTRDSSGELLKSNDLMKNAIETLKTYKEGTDRNAAALRIFGRPMQDLNQLLKLNDEALESARKKAEALGLTITDENVKAAQDFKGAQNDLGDVMQAFGRVVGNAVMPTLTRLAQAMVEMGTSLLPVFKGAVHGLTIAFLGLKMVADIVWEAILFGAKAVVNVLMGVGTGLYELLINRDPAAAAAAFKNAWTGIEQAWDTGLTSITDKARKNNEEMQRLLGMKPGDSDVDRTPTGTRSFVDPQQAKKAEQELLKTWKEQLEARKRMYGDYREMDKQEEARFWQEKLELAKGHSKDFKDKVLALATSARRAAAKEEISEAKQDMAFQMEVFKEDGEKRLMLQQEWVDKMARLYGEDSREYLEAIRAKYRMEQEETQRRIQLFQQELEQKRQLRAMDLNMEKELLQWSLELGLMSAQQGIFERAKLEQQLLADKRANIVEELAIAELTIERRRELNRQLEQIDKEAQQVRMRTEMDVVRYIYGQYAEVVGTILGSLEGITNGFLQGTMTWRKALTSLTNSIVSMFVRMGFDVLRNWIMVELLKTKVSQGAAAAQVAAQVMASGEVAGAKAAEGMAVVGVNATEAASGAAASQASIPYVGPALAVAAAIAMMAFVLGLGGKGGGGGGGGAAPLGVGDLGAAGSVPMPSAAGGWWQVPRDTMAKIHEREMVIPAAEAEGLRNMIQGSGGGGAAPSIVIQAMDSQDVARFLQRNRDKVGGVLRDIARNPMGVVR